MNQAAMMQVHVRLPTRLLFSGTALKVFAEAENGSFAAGRRQLPSDGRDDHRPAGVG